MTVIGFQSDGGSQDLSESHKKVDSLKEAKVVIEELL